MFLKQCHQYHQVLWTMSHKVQRVNKNSGLRKKHQYDYCSIACVNILKRSDQSLRNMTSQEKKMNENNTFLRHAF